uniref:Uncharacterized protein n=1 Tax=Chromera velia CCMP2878 TaxID=1169474 RepID=A0A0G4HNF9_9ALVE|eukprot:Cvel_29438.t1-p1 / transcript=Cvel_29438.t1 / gene=Cvel_29438 / organism=Chromera_velia_CCMP2878 / gene_product=hypothetical protein / transcript_product=hypothetical protein / location=Cvel_scaffold4022:5471-6589(+) / protein_length=373 / sequence_SO=supercontig / SO=protein_coding / is_pseudo=false
MAAIFPRSSVLYPVTHTPQAPILDFPPFRISDNPRQARKNEPVDVIFEDANGFPWKRPLSSLRPYQLQTTTGADPETVSAGQWTAVLQKWGYAHRAPIKVIPITEWLPEIHSQMYAIVTPAFDKHFTRKGKPEIKTVPEKLHGFLSGRQENFLQLPMGVGDEYFVNLQQVPDPNIRDSAEQYTQSVVIQLLQASLYSLPNPLLKYLACPTGHRSSKFPLPSPHLLFNPINLFFLEKFDEYYIAAEREAKENIEPMNKASVRRAAHDTVERILPDRLLPSDPTDPKRALELKQEHKFRKRQQFPEDKRNPGHPWEFDDQRVFWKKIDPRLTAYTIREPEMTEERFYELVRSTRPKGQAQLVHNECCLSCKALDR